MSRKEKAREALDRIWRNVTLNALPSVKKSLEPDLSEVIAYLEKNPVVEKIKEAILITKKELGEVQKNKTADRETWMHNVSILKNRISAYEKLLEAETD